MPHNDSVEAFRTHANYLRALARLACDSPYSSRGEAYSSMVQRVLASNILPVTRISEIDLQQVRTSLENAWGTELLLALGAHVARDEEIIRLSNNWNVVQAYYVFYHATQAIVVCKGNARPTTHPKTQQLYFQIFTRSNQSLAPWTLGFGDNGPVNILEELTINHRLHSWTTCTEETAWSLACKAFRTTREEMIPNQMQKKRVDKRNKRKKEWEEEEKERLRAGRAPRQIPKFRLPLLTESEKQNVCIKLRPFTLMDYLYRLRIRSNYEDSAMFTDGPEEEGQSGQVREDLLLLSGSVALLAELFLTRLIGNNTIQQWANNWLERNKAPGWTADLAERYILYNDLE